MDSPGISIVIPLFNKAHVIREVLLSVLNQSSPPDELIIVDDASRDGSLDIAHSFRDAFGKRFPIKVLRNVDRRGPSFARNVGIEHSSQEYLYFLDADDLMFPNTILNLRKAISITKPDIIFTKALLSLSLKTHPGKKIFNYAEIIEKTVFRVVDPFGLLADEFPFVGSNFAVSKRFDIRFGNDERQFEDCLFVFEHILKAQRVIYVDAFSIIYNQNSVNKLSLSSLKTPNQTKLPHLYQLALMEGHPQIARHIFQIWMSYLATRASNRALIIKALIKFRQTAIRNFRWNKRYLSPYLRLVMPSGIFKRSLKKFR
jgi:glycosyltransferase involved in cell wall biosynthesis